MSTLVTIIIPTYNRAHLLRETLNSVCAQTYPYWECIIVDDGSTDDTLEILNQFVEVDSRFKVFKRPNLFKKGPSGCRNFAFQLSLGKFIQFFDSDDIMHPDHLLKKMQLLNNSEVDFVVCKLKSFSTNQGDVCFYDHDVPDFVVGDSLFESFATGSFPMMMQMPMWRKNVLDEVMPFREDIQLLEDHELYLRILASERNVGIINDVLILYRTAEISITNNFYKNISLGIDSFLKVKQTAVRLLNENNVKIKLSILKQVLALVRTGLSQKQYPSAEKCLKFIKDERLAYNFGLQMKVVRINIFYFVFKFLKRGDTKFKSLLKL